MRTLKNFFKKIFSMYLVLIIVLSVIINILIGYNEVQAASYTQYKKTGIDEFPESYKTYLNELVELHPNWNFTAFYTGITWNDFMNNESSLGGSKYSHGKNTIINSVDSLWKDSCGVVKSGYACASPDIIAYFADPRNFLTETGVFQFLEMSYNSDVHIKSGVESIIKNTFMDTSVSISGEQVETAVKAKIKDEYILVTPGTTNKEIASTLGIDNYKVKDKSNNEVSTKDKALTGNTFIKIVNSTAENTNTNTVTGNNVNTSTAAGNTTNNTVTGNNISGNNTVANTTQSNVSYTIVVLGDVDGDGKVEANDYIAIKNHIAGRKILSEVEKYAADVLIDGGIEATDYIKVKNYIAGRTNIYLSTIKKDIQISYADMIMKAAEESGISPYSIAIKIIQEVGRQGSNSVKGTYPGYEGYYNFYNIGAYDSGNAIENGLKYAKEKGWNSQYKSIVEGAKYMSDSYISVGQNTAYFYKFDVIDGVNGVFWHQYMTNIQDPSSQAKILYNTYANNELLDLSLNFLIPVYDDMPNVCKLPGAIDANDPTSYYVNGTGVNIRQSPTVNSTSIRNTFTK